MSSVQKSQRTIRCLGVPEIRIDEKPHGLSNQHRRLIAVLTAAGPDGLGTDVILDELYAERLPKTRNQAIYSLVNRLDEKAASFVVNVDGRYQVAPGVTVDTWHFDDISTSHEPSAIIRSIELWRGRPFEDVEAGPVLSRARADLQRKRSQIVEAAARSASRDQLEQIERQIQHSIDDDPYNEALAIAGAGAFYRLGRRRDALGTLQMCRTKLRNDLGLDGGIELDDAELAVLRQRDPLESTSIRTARLQQSPRPLPTILTPRAEHFVGREQPIRALSTALEATVSNQRGAIAVVSGAAGIGKSELVSQFVAANPDVEARVATSAGASIAYASWVGALPELADDVDDLGRASDLGIAHMVFWKSVERQLSQLSSSTPILVVLENMHESDPQSALLLQWLASSALPPRVLIVTTTRDPEPGSAWERVLPTLHDDGAERSLVTMIELEPLTLTDIQRLVNARFSNEPPARQHRFAAQVHNLSQGNALVGTALIADSASADDIVTSTTQALEDHHAQAILNRVDPTAAGILTNAGLIGREFDLDVLAELCEMTSMATLVHVENAMAEDLVFETDDSGRFRFNHVLTAEAFASRSSVTGRTNKFGRLAKNSSLPAADRVRYVRGAESEISVTEAVEILESASQELLSGLAFSEAQSADELAVERLRADGKEPTVELLIRRADAASRAGDTARLVTYRQEAFDAAKRSKDAHAMADAALAGMPASERGSGDEERFNLLKQIDRQRIEQPETLERFTYHFARSARIMHHPALASEILAELDLDDISSPEMRAMFQSERFSLAGQNRFIPEAGPVIEELIEELAPGATRTTLRVAHLLQSFVAQDPRATGRLFEQARAETLAHPVPRARWMLELNEVTLAQLGMVQSVNEHSSVMATGFRLGVTDALEAWGAQCWQKLWIDSKYEDALALIDGSIGLIEPNVGWWAAESFAAAKTGDHKRSRRMLDKVRNELENDPSGVWSSVGGALTVEACTTLRDDVDVPLRSALEVLLPHSDSAIVLGIGAAYFGPADGFIGRAMHLLDDSEAGHYLERAEEQATRTGATYWRDRTRRLTK